MKSSAQRFSLCRQTGAITVKTVSEVDVLDIDTNTYAHVYACVYLCVYNSELWTSGQTLEMTT